MDVFLRVNVQVKVAEKSNEITAIPTLLSRLDIAGAVITMDCQKKFPLVKFIFHPKLLAMVVKVKNPKSER